jgi:uncharacterized membrane protein
MHFETDIGAAVLGDWTFAFHDSTGLDWAITLGYLGVAGLCFYGWWKHRRDAVDGKADVRGFWLVVGIVMVLLGVNKQLNFQTLLTDLGRDAAAQQGWYERRRTAQKLFVIAFTLVGAAAVGALGWWVRRAWRKYLLALVGLCFAGIYAVVRAASFHHVLTQREGARHHPIAQEILEMAAIALIGVAAWRGLRGGRCSKPKLQAHERIVRIG